MPRRDPEAPWQKKEIPFDFSSEATASVLGSAVRTRPERGDWFKGAANRELNSDGDVGGAFDIAAFMARLRQKKKGKAFHLLAIRLLACIEMLEELRRVGNQEVVLSGIRTLSTPLDPKSKKKLPELEDLLSTSKDPSLPPVLSEGWFRARQEYERFVERARASARDEPTCPTCGQTIYSPGVRIKPGPGRPRKYCGASYPGRKSSCREAEHRRRRELVAILNLHGEFEKILDDDQKLLDLVRDHTGELRDKGYSYEATVIEGACEALVEGRHEVARLMAASSA